MSHSGANEEASEARLRERIPQTSRHSKAQSSEIAKEVVMRLNSAEEASEDDVKEKKTFGRTPDGVVFTVPQTHDMVSQLLSPSQAKNISDIIVIAVLLIHVVAVYLLPKSARVSFTGVVFLFWRACYNAGIGYLLYSQSRDKRLVNLVRKSKILEHPSEGSNPYPGMYWFLKQEFEKKIPKDYKFEEAPLEYNTWLIFRRVVDLVLMCDFTSYMLFAIVCGCRPTDEGVFITAARWVAGIALFLFNLWVKLDAHRVVKDFAWYWGDFFYLIDQELTFDGVFEMAPHPMYSVGYAGYYGISLMAASYKVLFISIIAHAAQFAFLVLVESPHIEKTYSPPPPPRKNKVKSSGSAAQPSPIHQLLGAQNIDFHRITDVVVILFQLYLFTFALLSPSTPFFQIVFVINAIIWRLWFGAGVGYILHRQSTQKEWTRHFIKYGDSVEEAWRQWKSIYHLSTTMCYASFVCAAWKMYSLPPDWEYGMALLRHVVGAAMVALQVWTAISIYDSLGEFGWFFGDFFFDHAPKLTYSGIYRFLNNPERFLGLAGIWGIALITWSKTIFFLALLSHLVTLLFIQLVERPHMQKLYGQSIRQDSGLSKSLRRSLPSPILGLQGSVDRALGETLDFFEDLVESARPRMAVGVGTFVKDTTALFKQYPARITISRLAPDLAGYDPKDYSLTVDGTRLPLPLETNKRNRCDGEEAAAGERGAQTLIFEYGAPIRVRWTAPINHSKNDWVGLYRVADNVSREITSVSSRGRWLATNPGSYDSAAAQTGILEHDRRAPASSRTDGEIKDYLFGEIEFSGDKLWWTTGVFELRYHHDGRHNVMAISRPFEVRIPRFDEDDVELDANGLVRGAVEQALLPVVRNCFDRDPEIAPSTVDESFGSLVEREGKFAKRVVFAVQQMFGIEFAPEVVQSDGTVKNLAWRICNAKKVLAPYSMSRSRGTSTPINSY